MDSRNLRRVWLTPLIFFQTYLSFCLLIFFYGPWPWDIDNPGILTIYLLMAQVFILIGYLAAWPKIMKSSKRYRAIHFRVFQRWQEFLKTIYFHQSYIVRSHIFLTDRLHNPE